MVLPNSRLLLCIGALALPLSLFGCTSTGGINLAAELEAVANDPELPDEVALVPSAAGERPEVVEVSEAQASPAEAQAATVTAAEAVSAENGLPGIAAQGYAGATPSGPKASAALAERVLPTGKVAARSPELDRLISHYAGVHRLPESLLRRVVHRESTFNPGARNGPYWGLMQILPQTARTMGYRGSPEGLLDAETNLKYAGKYLRGAYMVADGDHDRAVRLYARGYYYDAKRKGMLEATGLR